MTPRVKSAVLSAIIQKVRRKLQSELENQLLNRHLLQEGGPHTCCQGIFYFTDSSDRPPAKQNYCLSRVTNHVTVTANMICISTFSELLRWCRTKSGLDAFCRASRLRLPVEQGAAQYERARIQAEVCDNGTSAKQSAAQLPCRKPFSAITPHVSFLLSLVIKLRITVQLPSQKIDQRSNLHNLSNCSAHVLTAQIGFDWNNG